MKLTQLFYILLTGGGRLVSRLSKKKLIIPLSATAVTAVSVSAVMVNKCSVNKLNIMLKYCFFCFCFLIYHYIEAEKYTFPKKNSWTKKTYFKQNIRERNCVARYQCLCLSGFIKYSSKGTKVCKWTEYMRGRKPISQLKGEVFQNKWKNRSILLM